MHAMPGSIKERDLASARVTTSTDCYNFRSLHTPLALTILRGEQQQEEQGRRFDM